MGAWVSSLALVMTAPDETEAVPIPKPSREGNHTRGWMRSVRVDAVLTFCRMTKVSAQTLGSRLRNPSHLYSLPYLKIQPFESSCFEHCQEQETEGQHALLEAGPQTWVRPGLLESVWTTETDETEAGLEKW